jgi:predicted secreted protein
MAATISTTLAIYFVLWWLVLFVTLPFGVRSQHEDGASGDGTDPGAPVATQMGRKMIWTTAISTAIFALAMAAYHAGYFNIERLSKLMGIPL